jgi:NTE family protein
MTLQCSVSGCIVERFPLSTDGERMADPVNISADASANVQPIRAVADDTAEKIDKPEKGMALCLSGGGYRAMVFHMGAIWRINEAGLLKDMKRISSVSGGSITSGMLGLKWKNLKWQGNVATNLAEEVVDPILSMADHTIDVFSIAGGILSPFKTIGDEIADAYRGHLFGHATLQDLPSDNEGPRFVINSTNVQTKAVFRFSKPFMGDWKVGLVKNPKVELAVAVGCSSAFPPLLSPVELKLNPADFDKTTDGGFQKSPFNSDLILCDGGVYDNLGLETAWKKYETILVSDGGGTTPEEPSPHKDWAQHSFRILMLMYSQIGSLRKRQVIGSYQLGLRKGTYWGITTDIKNYQLNDALPCPFQKTNELAGTPTRLKAMGKVLKERLVNWGYAVCDAGLRKHVDPKIARPKGFPYPSSAV